MDSLLTSPHRVWSESVSKLVKEGASSVRSPFLAPLQPAPFTSASVGTPSQAISHPNSRWSPQTKCGYPALCTLQPDESLQKYAGDLPVTLVIQTPQWFPIAFPVKPKYSPLTFTAFHNEALKLTFAYLFSQLSPLLLLQASWVCSSSLCIPEEHL